ncbi:MAG: D-alanine--D-alanine ligase [Thermoflexales bacterium]|nr:D-alanine--D-alanine ligase [Thermoflexales bacterium]MDW8351517.1 D-alanine--D-alanine ligase family protein [Anaerolineae bacterium]
MSDRPRPGKLKVAVLYGGQSGEHEVSLMSAASVMKALDEHKYDITPVFISRTGEWALPFEALRRFDVVFPVLHGPMGEDGTVQGLLTLLGVPFVGAGVVGSAVGMDKAIFKDVMRAHGLPVVRHIVVRRSQWAASPAEVESAVVNQLGFPCFVKPANLGSSVGVTKVKGAHQLPAGMAEALKWDRKVLIEQAVPQARELEVSVLGNDELQASVVGEITPSREFYDYAAKYLDKGESASGLHIPAPIPDALAQLIREMAVEAATLADVRGMARVDFLMNGETGEVFINEINTIPGFTDISMYPKLWAATGIAYGELLDRLIELAMER